MTLSASATVPLMHPQLWIAEISARLRSFGAETWVENQHYGFDYTFGHARISLGSDHYQLFAQSPSKNGLSRLQELLAVAVELHARADNPSICWEGSTSDNQYPPQYPPQFREMRVIKTERLAPQMQRITLTGDDLYRFEEFDGIHARLLFPRADTKWPTLGQNGLPVWPDEPHRPALRVYTIRSINAAQRQMVIDFVLHGSAGIGGHWAQHAKIGDVIGVIGPVGRPIRLSQWLMMGADLTGLPALSRLVEALPLDAAGHAFIEVQDKEDAIPFKSPAGFTVHWLYRGKGPSRLVETILAQDWVEQPHSFGWFAAEHGQAHIIRQHWRGTLGLSRDRSLVAGYWKLGQQGAMAKI